MCIRSSYSRPLRFIRASGALHGQGTHFCTASGQTQPEMASNYTDHCFVPYLSVKPTATWVASALAISQPLFSSGPLDRWTVFHIVLCCTILL